MFTKTQKKAADLVKELKKEIMVLEAELSHKKQLLGALAQLDRKAPKAMRSMGTRTGGIKRPTARKYGAKAPVQRKSKNRDIIIGAANRIKKNKFTLGELKDEIRKKNPKFGGDYPSGTILAVLKNTPQIRKVKRGTYSYKKKK